MLGGENKKGAHHMTNRFRAALIAVVLVVANLPAVATAGPKACDKRVNNTINKLLECVNVDGVRGPISAVRKAPDGVRDTRGLLADIERSLSAGAEVGA